MLESFALTPVLNHLLLQPELAGYQWLGIHPAEATEKALQVNQAFGLELILGVGMILFFLLVRFSLSVEKPNAAQQVAEIVYEQIGNQAEQVIGHGYSKFQAFVTCIFLFVLINNLVGLIPGTTAPTSHPWVPLGLAFPTFLYYNYQGLRANGLLGYLKQFAGPIPVMAPLIFLIETISHLARILSLTVRLYANMLAGDLITLVFFSLFPIAIPAIFLGLHVFVSLIQAFVFMLLTMIYLSLAVSHEH